MYFTFFSGSLPVRFSALAQPGAGGDAGGRAVRRPVQEQRRRVRVRGEEEGGGEARGKVQGRQGGVHRGRGLSRQVIVKLNMAKFRIITTFLQNLTSVSDFICQVLTNCNKLQIVMNLN